MEKFIDLLRMIAEKHLFQAIASVALAILAVAFLPDLFEMTDKVGKTMYGILVFCLGFLLIQCAKHICAVAKNKVAEREEKRLTDELQQNEAVEKEARAITRLWDYVESLTPQDRFYLVRFLETGNQPIEVMGEPLYNGLLADSDIVACMEKQQKCTPALNFGIEFEGHLVFPPQDIISSSPTKLYRLKDDFFELLRLSYEKYGKISHFDMEALGYGQTKNANSKQG